MVLDASWTNGQLSGETSLFNARMTKFTIFVLFGSIVIQLNSAQAQQNVFDQGVTVLAGVAAQGKEIIDHGVNIKSEKQHSIDFFGLKLGSNNGIKTGFGDAASDNPSASAEDVLLRKKRSMDLLATLRSTGLVSSSATGLSVNMVTINSVSNVNNYGPTPETTTTAESRRRKRLDSAELGSKLPIDKKLNDKVSYFNELQSDGLSKKRFDGKTDEKQNSEKFLRKYNDGFETRNDKVASSDTHNEIKPDGSIQTRLAIKPDVKLQTDKPSLYRSKRSPQESNSVTTPANPSGDNGPRDGAEGGPNDGGGGRRGPGRRGPGPKRGGNCRGPPPPPPPSDEDDSDDGERRRKREATHKTLTTKRRSNYRAGVVNGAGASNSNGYSSSSEYGSSSSEYYSSEDYGSLGAETSSPESLTIDIYTDQLKRDKRSPCGRRRRQNVTTTTIATTIVRRKKRELTPEQGAEQANSWFSTVIEVIVDSARRVVEATRKVFSKDRKEGMENNEDVETMK